MAHPEGLEPPTLGSEDRCSIQLSYGCFSGLLYRHACRCVKAGSLLMPLILLTPPTLLTLPAPLTLPTQLAALMPLTPLMP